MSKIPQRAKKLAVKPYRYFILDTDGNKRTTARRKLLPFGMMYLATVTLNSYPIRAKNKQFRVMSKNVFWSKHTKKMKINDQNNKINK